MRYTRIIFVSALVAALFYPSCENNNEFDLYGVQNCDTTNITWDSKISAIMQERCVKCHSAAFTFNNNGIRHDSYEEELKVVIDGRLKNAVNHTGPFKMPKNESQLPACELLLINLWIDNGAPEN